MGISAIGLASRYLEICNVLKSTRCVRLCDGKYTQNEIIDMMYDIYHMINYNFYITLPYDFIFYYIDKYNLKLHLDIDIFKNLFILLCSYDGTMNFKDVALLSITYTISRESCFIDNKIISDLILQYQNNFEIIEKMQNQINLSGLKYSI